MVSPHASEPPSTQPSVKTRGGRRQGQLPILIRKGSNVKDEHIDPWPENAGFDSNVDNKRRKTIHSSPIASALKRNASVVDLIGDDEDNTIECIGSRARKVRNINGQMPPPSSAHVMSVPGSSTRPSQRSARSRISVAPYFGELPEFKSLIRKTDSRPLSRRGISNGFQPHQPKQTQHTRSEHFIASTSYAVNSDGTHDERFRRQGLASRAKEQPGIMTYDDATYNEDDEMEVVQPQAGDEVSSKQREAELQDRAAREDFRRRDQEKKHRQNFDSDDELAASDQAHAIRRLGQASTSDLNRRNLSSSPRSLRRRREVGVSSVEDIQTTEFTRSKVHSTLTTKGTKEGDQSGWNVQIFASNLVTQIEGDIHLQFGSRALHITYQKRAVKALDITKITECVSSGKFVILTGGEDYWAVIKFSIVPDRLGFTAQFKNSNRHVTTKDPLDSGVMEGLSMKMLRERCTDAGRLSVRKEKKPIDQEVELLEKRVDNFRTADTEASHIRQLRHDERPPMRLISQMRVSDQGQRNQESQPSTGFVRSPHLRSCQNDKSVDAKVTAFVSGEKSTVDEAADSLLRRSDRRGKRITSLHFVDIIDAGQAHGIVPDEERYSRKVGLGDEWEFSLTYPLTGKDRATVEFQDLERLDDGEFLNDNLIEFYLRWARQQHLEQGTCTDEQVHFFNTFFYEKLASSGRSIDYKAVESWTRKVDIFDIDYVVVPVNENAHWYVCIICNLPKFKCTEVDLTEEAETNERKLEIESSPGDLLDQLSAAAAGTTVSERANLINEATTDKELMLSSKPRGVLPKNEEHDQYATDNLDEPSSITGYDRLPSSEALQDMEIAPRIVGEVCSQDSINITRNDGVFKNAKVSTPKSGKVKRRRSGPTPRKYDPKTIIIITLDSLGLTHSKTTSNLKDYIIAEGAAKHGFKIHKEDIKGMNVTRGIPQQQNYCDCGVFLLGYIHKFLDEPRAFVTKILANEMDEVEDWPDMDPKALRANVRDTIQKTYQDQLPERRSMKKNKRKTKPAGANKIESPAINKRASPARPEPIDRDSNASQCASPRIIAVNQSRRFDDSSKPPSNTINPNSESAQRPSQRMACVANMPFIPNQDSQEIMLLDVHDTGAEEVTDVKNDEDMLLTFKDSEVEPVIIPSPPVSISSNRKRLREESDIEEIPDSQGWQEAGSKSPRKQGLGRAKDAVERLEDIHFPPFPSR